VTPHACRDGEGKRKKEGLVGGEGEEKRKKEGLVGGEKEKKTLRNKEWWVRKGKSKPRVNPIGGLRELPEGGR